MEKKSDLELVAEPQDYFRELIQLSLERNRVEAQAETQVYLIKLLIHFMSTDNLYARDSDGSRKEEPLTFLFKEAIEQVDPKLSSLLFRHLGDVTLYTAGYFQERLERKRVPLSYYIDLGGVAYERVATATGESTAGMYLELSEKFGSFVGVLADVSTQTQPKTDQNVLRVYEQWMATKSERAEKFLREAGILSSAVKDSGGKTKNKKKSN